MTTVALSDRQLDLGAGQVQRAGRVLHRLSARERVIVGLLVSQLAETVSREAIQQATSTANPAALDQAMSRLRAKIEVDPKQPRHLKTVWGVGFRLVAERTTVATPFPYRARTPDRVGRTQEIERIVELHDQHGAALVTGPGGAGKTTVADGVLAKLAAAGRPAYFADLTACHTRDQVVGAVLTAIGTEPSSLGPGSWAEGVAASLTTRGPCTLVLDNCEQVTDPVADLVTGWRAQMPTTGLVLTSRIAMHLAGVPELELDVLPVDDAVAMLVRRAEAARPGWAAEAARSVLVDLVEHLDRLPLALELASARARLFDPVTLLKALSEGIGLSRRQGPERHRSIPDMVRWSTDLLDAATRRAFVQCAVFRGGFDLPAAEAVLDAGEDSMDALHVLIDSHLLTSSETGRGRRLGMLPVVHDVVSAWLADDEALLQTSTERHARHYDARLRASHQRADAAWVEAERSNLLAASRVVPDEERAEFLVRAADLVTPHLGGAWRAEVLRQALDATRTGQDALRARVLVKMAVAHRFRADVEAEQRALDEAEACAMRTGDPLVQCLVLKERAFSRRNGGDVAGGMDDIRRALRIAQDHGLDDKTKALLWWSLARLAVYADALGVVEEAAAGVERTAAPDSILGFQVISLLAEALTFRDPEASIALMDDSIARMQAVGDAVRPALTFAPSRRAMANLVLGRFEAALADIAWFVELCEAMQYDLPRRDGEALHALVLVAVGRHDAALEAVRNIDERAHGPYLHRFLGLKCAVVEAIVGDVDVARDLLEAARAACPATTGGGDEQHLELAVHWLVDRMSGSRRRPPEAPGAPISQFVLQLPVLVARSRSTAPR